MNEIQRQWLQWAAEQAVAQYVAASPNLTVEARNAIRRHVTEGIPLNLGTVTFIDCRYSTHVDGFHFTSDDGGAKFPPPSRVHVDAEWTATERAAT